MRRNRTAFVHAALCPCARHAAQLGQRISVAGFGQGVKESPVLVRHRRAKLLTLDPDVSTQCSLGRYIRHARDRIGRFTRVGEARPRFPLVTLKRSFERVSALSLAGELACPKLPLSASALALVLELPP